jgi:hypothetical protein
MKTIRIIVVIGALLATSAAHASLIDLTPGGFSWDNQPPVFSNWLYHIQSRTSFLIAGANINGSEVQWSPYTMFGPDNFKIAPQQPDAFTAWNLTDTSGHFLQYICVSGFGPDNQITDNLYRVTGRDIFNSSGFVTIDGQRSITSIVFYGTNIVPETVNTGWLLFFAVVGVLLTYKARPRGIGG